MQVVIFSEVLLSHFRFKTPTYGKDSTEINTLAYFCDKNEVSDSITEIIVYKQREQTCTARALHAQNHFSWV